MSRIFSVGKTKGLGQSICRKQTTICSEQARKLELIGYGVCSPRCRFYGQYVSNSIGHASSIAHRMHNTFQGSYLMTSRGTAVRNHAETAWKKLSRKYFHEGQTFISLSRFAQALFLALSRSYVILPSFLALAYGRNIALAQAPPDLEYGRLPMTSFYRHAEDGHFLVTLLLHSIFEGFVLLLRAVYLGILFYPSIVMAPFADAFGPAFRKLWLQVVRNTLERAGPAFIKWGQWAATWPDLFPKDLCTELSKLHTKAPERSFAYTQKTIRKAFGREISEIFDEFEEKPLASGSIAQVHRASLLYQYRGRQIKPITVAVKVRHPGVGESIRRDFEIINPVAKISKYIPKLKWLRLMKASSNLLFL